MSAFDVLEDLNRELPADLHEDLRPASALRRATLHLADLADLIDRIGEMDLEALGALETELDQRAIAAGGKLGAWDRVKLYLVRTVKAEIESDRTRDRMQEILTKTAEAIKGPPAPLTSHGWSDLPDLAARMRATNMEYWKAVCALEDAPTDAHEEEALRWLHEIRIGNGWTDVPDPLVKRAVEAAEAAQREVETLKARVTELEGKVREADDDLRRTIRAADPFGI